jgi:hydrogenase expression/formation protein HypD
VALLVDQAVAGRAAVEISYTRAVHRAGNPAARACLDAVFEPADAVWRGLGVIPGSGLRIRAAYAAHDAARFAPPAEAAPEPAGCACGRILRGQCAPADCGHFGVACSPAHPLGPCMVSSEGACAAAYRFERGAAHA